MIQKGPHNELFCEDCLKFIKFIDKKSALRLDKLIKERKQNV